MIYLAAALFCLAAAAAGRGLAAQLARLLAAACAAGAFLVYPWPWALAIVAGSLAAGLIAGRWLKLSWRTAQLPLLAGAVLGVFALIGPADGLF